MLFQGGPGSLAYSSLHSSVMGKVSLFCLLVCLFVEEEGEQPHAWLSSEIRYSKKIGERKRERWWVNLLASLFWVALCIFLYRPKGTTINE